MKNILLATLSLVCMFTVAGGSDAPTAAAAPAATDSPTSPEIGGCRWVCSGISTRFTSQATCEAVCPTECEVIC